MLLSVIVQKKKIKILIMQLNLSKDEQGQHAKVSHSSKTPHLPVHQPSTKCLQWTAVLQRPEGGFNPSAAL